MISPLLAAADRLYWCRVIRRADIVDADFVRLQLGRPTSTRRAVRSYVRGGFRRGFSLNPLFLERHVSAQLPDNDRVPALYAYLVSDPAKVSTTMSWDAPAYATAHPESVTAPGGPLGHAWRRLRDGGEVIIGSAPHLRAVTLIDLLRSAALGLNPAEQVAPSGAISSSRVIIWHLGADDGDGATLAVLTPLAADGDTTVVLALEASAPADLRVAAAQVTLWHDDTAVVAGRAALALESATPDGTMLLVRGAGAAISSAAVRALLTEADSRPVQPLSLAPDGTIVSAATAACDGRTIALFAGHPIEDVRGLGDRIPTASLDAPVRAYRIGDRSQPHTLLSASATSSTSFASQPLAGAADTVLDALAPHRGLEFAVADLRGPSLRRRPLERFALADGESVPRLRWAIKTAAPAGTRGESWGDTHFARGLASALERLGQYVAVDARPAAHRATVDLDDVSLILRGPERIEPPESATTIQWIISHPDEITADEVGRFDLVYAASDTWSAEASVRLGRAVLPLLQCTDTTRFSPHGVQRSADLVFVGTARGIVRPSVVEPLRAGAPLRVYGPDWRGFIPASAIAGTHVPNDELPLVYEAAGAVMNDHWPAMQREGFVSNRLFDVVSAGGRAISDDVSGISELFAGAVRTYRTTPELLELVASPLDSLFPEDAELAEISAEVRRRHSFDARAKELLDAALAHRNGSTQQAVPAED